MAVLTHHWMVRERGGEKVLRAFRHLLPEAPIYTLVHDSREMVVGADWPAIHSSWLQRLPRATRWYPNYLPLMPAAARSVRLPEVDLVLCSDAAIAKAMRPHARSRVVCYCHSPIRYVWEPALRAQYAAAMPAWKRWLFLAATERVRRADAAAAERVDQFVANSHHVAARIKRCYGRECVVVHPPVELPAQPATEPRGDAYLCVGQHVPYKRLDLAVDACVRLGRRLVVVGDVPRTYAAQLRECPLIELHAWQSREALDQHYRAARALLFPGEEDFGIVPVEAIANGCPVIAYGVGGATETVVGGMSGVHFSVQTVDAVVDAIERFEALTFDPAAMFEAAQRFGLPRFLEELRAVLVNTLDRESARA